MRNNTISLGRIVFKFVCIILSCFTIVVLFSDLRESKISFLSVLLALFDLISVIIAIFPEEKLNHRIITHQQYDDHFVDRTDECKKALQFLQEKDNSILTVSGCQGIGKTQLLKTIADCINYASRWRKKYCAVYVKIPFQISVMDSVTETLSLEKGATIEDICLRIKRINSHKNWVFLLDNIMPENLTEAIDFSNAIIYHCPNCKIILGVTKISGNNELQPGRFGIDEIKLLEDTYNIRLNDNERKEIEQCSYGLPVYIRFLIENCSKGTYYTDYTIRDIDIYIKRLIDDNLSTSGQWALALISFYYGISNLNLSTKTLKKITKEANDYSIDELYRFSLIKVTNGQIEIESEIANRCREVLSSKSTESYELIYNYFNTDPNSQHIALRALLRTKKDNKSIDFTNKVFLSQHSQGNYYYFVYIGRDYLGNEIFLDICTEEHTRLLFWYYYFDSLLNLGMYPEARKLLDLNDNSVSKLLGILNCSDELSFQTNYLMIDLEHLTNHFYEAATLSFSLEQSCSLKAQKLKCRYLYAHCLKHMGNDLSCAEEIFRSLSYEPDKENCGQRIRALYSLISIHIFWGDSNFDYTGAFSQIKEWILSDPNAKGIIPNACRHYAYYLQIIEGNSTKAKEILDKAIEQLEKHPQRIKYDFYFELGEWYRLSFLDSASITDYQNSVANLNKAIVFSTEVGDYNLESMSRLSRILLNFHKSKENADSLYNEVLEIYKKTTTANMYINRSYSAYVGYVIRNKAIPQNIIDFWKAMRYMQLVTSANVYNKVGDCKIRLIIM